MPPKTNTASRRKPVSRRASSSRKKKQATSRTMPVWLRNLLAFGIVAVFSVGFYWFFIRPYAYREALLRIERLWGMYALQLRSAWH